MTRLMFLSACLIAATSGQALAYSKASPSQSSQVTAVDRSASGAFDTPAYAFAPDTYRYHGGPKAND